MLQLSYQGHCNWLIKDQDNIERTRDTLRPWSDNVINGLVWAFVLCPFCVPFCTSPFLINESEYDCEHLQFDNIYMGRKRAVKNTYIVVMGVWCPYQRNSILSVFYLDHSDRWKQTALTQIRRRSGIFNHVWYIPSSCVWGIQLTTSEMLLGSCNITLRKQAYSNILKILPPKNEKNQIKILIFFIFLLKT